MKHQTKNSVTPPKTSEQLLDMYYLEARSHLLETAAILDRVERAIDGKRALKDPRVKNLFRICDVLTNETENRAEQLLNLLSVS